MRFDRKQFYVGYRKEFGALNSVQVSGLNQLLDFIEADKYLNKVTWIAYVLATVKHETAHTFHPIHEYGGKAYFVKRYGGQTRKGKELGNDTPDEGYYYAGKGYPQTTGEANYEKAEKAIRTQYPELVADFEQRTGKTFDLTVGDQPNDANDPQNMLDPAIAYATMSYGMRTGMFTTKKLSDYLGTDYVEARRIINGKDKASVIATIARKFERILKNSAASSTQTATTTPAVKSLDESSVSTEPPTNLEVTQTSTTTTDGNTETLAVTAKNEQDVTVPAVVEGVKPFNEIGLGGTLKNDAKAILPANIGLSTVSEWIQQTTGWPVWVTALIPKLVIVLLACTALWLIYRLVTYLTHTWRENERVKLLAIINANPKTKDLILK